MLGIEPGSWAIASPHVDSLGMVGAATTYDAIVWGVGAEGARRKAANDKLCTKPFFAELGAVTPYVVVPGEWSERELELEANKLAAIKLGNSGCHCSSPQVLVLDRTWPLADAFVRAVHDALASAVVPPSVYYPGVAKRLPQFAEHCADTELLHKEVG